MVTGGLTVDGQAVTGSSGASTSKNVPWTTVYTNGTVLIVQYSVDALGIVRLRGSFLSVNSGIVAFTMPPQGRPPQTSIFSIAVVSSGFANPARVTITAAGAVSTTVSANQSVYVDGVSYDTSAT